MPTLKNILVPTDLTPESSSAAQWAVDMAEEAKITVLFVPVTLAELYPALTTPVEIRAVDTKIRHQAQTDLEEWVQANIRGKHDIATEIRSGEPADQIVRAAADLGVDVIVMSAHSRAGWKHLLLGSVTQKVLRNAECPVVVTRPKKARGAGRATSRGSGEAG